MPITHQALDRQPPLISHCGQRAQWAIREGIRLGLFFCCYQSQWLVSIMDSWYLEGLMNFKCPQRGR